MEIMNLVVTGTLGAGKSTFIISASQMQVAAPDKHNTGDEAFLSQDTTASIDFETLQFEEEMALHIYGTPSQVRFDFMWEILIERAHAYMLLIAAHRSSEFHYARRILNFMNQHAQIPMIIGITHNDCEGAWCPEDIALALGYHNSTKQPPIVAVNTQDRASVAMALITLMEQCL